MSGVWFPITIMAIFSFNNIDRITIKVIVYYIHPNVEDVFMGYSLDALLDNII